MNAAGAPRAEAQGGSGASLRREAGPDPAASNDASSASLAAQNRAATRAAAREPFAAPAGGTKRGGTTEAASPTASDPAAQETSASTPGDVSPSAAAAPGGGMPPAVSAPARPASAAPRAPTPAPQGRVVVVLAKLESDRGQVQAALFRGAAGFPDEPSKAAIRKSVKIRNRQVDLVFEGVPPGPFAVLVHHDENGDGKMQTGLFGIPAEGYGISRDAPANFGPPSYEDARLVLRAGEAKRIVVEMRY